MILRTWRPNKVRVISQPDRTLKFISIEFTEGILLEAIAYLAPWLKGREWLPPSSGITMRSE